MYFMSFSSVQFSLYTYSRVVFTYMYICYLVQLSDLLYLHLSRSPPVLLFWYLAAQLSGRPACPAVHLSSRPVCLGVQLSSRPGFLCLSNCPGVTLPHSWTNWTAGQTGRLDRLNTQIQLYILGGWTYWAAGQTGWLDKLNSWTSGQLDKWLT